MPQQFSDKLLERVIGERDPSAFEGAKTFSGLMARRVGIGSPAEERVQPEDRVDLTRFADRMRLYAHVMEAVGTVRSHRPPPPVFGPGATGFRRRPRFESATLEGMASVADAGLNTQAEFLKGLGTGLVGMSFTGMRNAAMLTNGLNSVAEGLTGKKMNQMGAMGNALDGLSAMTLAGSAAGDFIEQNVAPASQYDSGSLPKWLDPRVVAGTTGRAIPEFAAAIAAAYGTGGASIPIQFGAFAGTAAMPVVGRQFTEAYNKNIQLGTNRTEASQKALVEAIGAGLITIATNSLPYLGMFGKANPKALKLLERLGQKESVKFLKKTAQGSQGRRQAVSGLFEGVQESVEQIGTDWLASIVREDPELATKIFTGDPEYWSDIGLAFVTGAILGGAAEGVIGGPTQAEVDALAPDQKRRSILAIRAAMQSGRLNRAQHANAEQMVEILNENLPPELRVEVGDTETPQGPFNRFGQESAPLTVSEQVGVRMRLEPKIETAPRRRGAEGPAPRRASVAPAEPMDQSNLPHQPIRTTTDGAMIYRTEEQANQVATFLNDSIEGIEGNERFEVEAVGGGKMFAVVGSPIEVRQPGQFSRSEFSAMTKADLKKILGDVGVGVEGKQNLVDLAVELQAMFQGTEQAEPEPAIRERMTPVQEGTGVAEARPQTGAGVAATAGKPLSELMAESRDGTITVEQLVAMPPDESRALIMSLSSEQADRIRQAILADDMGYFFDPGPGGAAIAEGRVDPVDVAETGVPISIEVFRGAADPKAPGVGGARWFSTDRDVAGGFAKSTRGTVSAERVSFSNPLVTKNFATLKNDLGVPASTTTEEVFQAASAQGFDGIILREMATGTEVVQLAGGSLEADRAVEAIEQAQQAASRFVREGQTASGEGLGIPTGEPEAEPVVSDDENPLVFFRGTEPGRTERIDEVFTAASGKAFVARRRSSARNYGSSIERIVASEDANILRQEDPEFWEVTGLEEPPNGMMQSIDGNVIDNVNAAIRAAEFAGYDAISFSQDSDIGTVILNESAFTREDVPRGTSAPQPNFFRTLTGTVEPMAPVAEVAKPTPGQKKNLVENAPDELRVLGLLDENGEMDVDTFRRLDPGERLGLAGMLDERTRMEGEDAPGSDLAPAQRTALRNVAKKLRDGVPEGAEPIPVETRRLRRSELEADLLAETGPLASMVEEATALTSDQYEAVITEGSQRSDVPSLHPDTISHLPPHQQAMVRRHFNINENGSSWELVIESIVGPVHELINEMTLTRDELIGRRIGEVIASPGNYSPDTVLKAFILMKQRQLPKGKAARQIINRGLQVVAPGRLREGARVTIYGTTFEVVTGSDGSGLVLRDGPELPFDLPMELMAEGIPTDPGSLAERPAGEGPLEPPSGPSTDEGFDDGGVLAGLDPPPKPRSPGNAIDILNQSMSSGTTERAVEAARFIIREENAGAFIPDKMFKQLKPEAKAFLEQERRRLAGEPAEVVEEVTEETAVPEAQAPQAAEPTFVTLDPYRMLTDQEMSQHFGDDVRQMGTEAARDSLLDITNHGSKKLATIADRAYDALTDEEKADGGEGVTRKFLSQVASIYQESIEPRPPLTTDLTDEQRRLIDPNRPSDTAPRFTIPFGIHLGGPVDTPGEGGTAMLITRSTRRPGFVQLSFFHNGEATGHEDHFSVLGALSRPAAVKLFTNHPVFRNRAGMMSEGFDYNIVVKARKRIADARGEDVANGIFNTHEYTYISPLRPFSMPLPAPVRGIGDPQYTNVDDTKGFLLTTEPIPLALQEQLELVPLSQEAVEAGLSDWLIQNYPEHAKVDAEAQAQPATEQEQQADRKAGTRDAQLLNDIEHKLDIVLDNPDRSEDHDAAREVTIDFDAGTVTATARGAAVVTEELENIIQIEKDNRGPALSDEEIAASKKYVKKIQAFLKRLNKPAEQESEATSVYRFTVNGVGLINNTALDRSRLSDSEELRLAELLDLGLQQPMGVPSNATFAFTQEGLEKHKKLLKLLRKAARGKVVKTKILITDNVWESNDGQVAFLESHVEATGSRRKKAKTTSETSAVAKVAVGPKPPTGFTSDPEAFGVNPDMLERDPEVRGLWHATTARDAVLKAGLRPQSETGKSGLGTPASIAHARATISATWSEQHALLAAERLRLAILAAKGQVSPSQVVEEFMEQEGMPDDSPSTIARFIGAPEEVRDDWDSFNDWADAQWEGSQYELLVQLDENGNNISPGAEESRTVGLTSSREQMAAHDQDQVDVLSVAGREGSKPSENADETELRFSPDDVFVIHENGPEVSSADRRNEAVAPSLGDKVIQLANKWEASSRAALKAQGARVFSLIPADLMFHWASLGAAKLLRVAGKGMNKSVWMKEMIADIGPSIVPHLNAVYIESWKRAKEYRDQTGDAVNLPTKREVLDAAKKASIPAHSRDRMTDTVGGFVGGFRAGSKRAMAEAKKQTQELRAKLQGKADSVQGMKDSLTRIVQDYLPLELRGALVTQIRSVRTLGQYAKALGRVNEVIQEDERKRSVRRLKKLIAKTERRIPKLRPQFKAKLESILGAIQATKITKKTAGRYTALVDFLENNPDAVLPSYITTKAREIAGKIENARLVDDMTAEEADSMSIVISMVLRMNDMTNRIIRDRKKANLDTNAEAVSKELSENLKVTSMFAANRGKGNKKILSDGTLGPEPEQLPAGLRKFVATMKKAVDTILTKGGSIKPADYTDAISGGRNTTAFDVLYTQVWEAQRRAWHEAHKAEDHVENVLVRLKLLPTGAIEHVGRAIRYHEGSKELMRLSRHLSRKVTILGKIASAGKAKLDEPIEAVIEEVELDDGTIIKATQAELGALVAKLEDPDTFDQVVFKKSPITLSASPNEVSWNLTANDVAKIRERLTPDMRVIVNEMVSYVNGPLKALVRRWSIDKYGYDITKADTYWPRVRRGNFIDPSSILDAAELAGQKALDSAGITRERSPDNTKPIEVGDIFVEFQNYSWAASNISHLEPQIVSAMKVLNHESVDGLLQNAKRGREVQAYYRRLYKVMARQVVGGPGDSAIIAPIMRGLVNLMTVGMLGANPKVMLYQPLSILNASVEIEEKYLVMAGAAAMDFSINDRMAKHSPVIRRRIKSSAMGIINGMNMSARRMFGFQTASEIPMMGISLMDQLAVRVIWRATEIKIARQFKDAGQDVESDAYWDAVAREAERIVQNTQPVFDAMHQSGIALEAKSNGILMPATMYYSQRNQNVNMMYRAWLDLKRAVASGDSKESAKASLRFQSTFGKVVVGNAMGVQVIRFAWAWMLAGFMFDDEEKEKQLENFTKGFLSNVVGNLYFAEAVSTPLLKIMFPKSAWFETTEFSPVLGVLSDASDGLAKMASAVATQDRRVDWDQFFKGLKKLGFAGATASGFGYTSLTRDAVNLVFDDEVAKRRSPRRGRKITSDF